MLTRVTRHPSDLLFGGQNAGNTLTQRWLGPGFFAGTIPTAALPLELDAPRILHSIRIRCIAGTGSGNAIYTVYVDGIATAVTVTLLNAGTAGAATGFSVLCTSGGVVSVAADKTGTITAGQTNIICTIGALVT